MLNAPARTVFDVLTDFLSGKPSDQDILTYQLPDDLQARADALIERNGEGLLTFDEQMELFDFLRADDMVAMLKAKTKMRLQGSEQ